MQPSGGPSGSSRSSPATSPRPEQQQPAAAAQQQQQQQQLGFRSQGMMHHHEQQQAYQSGAPHGMMGVAGGSSFPQSSGPVPPFQGQRNLPQSGGPQGLVGGQMHNQVAMQQQAYLKFAMHQQQQQKSHGMLLQQHQQQQQAKMNMAGSSTRDQDMVNNPAKMQELMSLQAQMFKRHSEQLQQAEKQKEQGHPSNHEQRSGDTRPPMPPQGIPVQQMPPAGMIRPMQAMQGQVGIGSIGGNTLTPSQFQAIQTWAKEHNFDLSNPANMSMISQLLPIWQSSRMASMQKQNEASIAAQQQQASPSQVNSDAPRHGNVPGQGAPLKPRQPQPPSSLVPGGEEAKIANLSNLQLQQQLSAHKRENDRAVRPPMTAGNGGQTMQMPQSSGHVNKVSEQSNSKNALANSEAAQMQYVRQMQQLNQSTAPTATPGDTGGSQAPAQGARPHMGFTKHQLKVLKAQILAFRRLKRGDRTLPPEVLELIMSELPPDSQGQHASGPSATLNHEKNWCELC
uniref:QLQ domain-containing protein n=1 Tax=Arundo donax TaxID=35708 RepID=A0A0A9DB77_ARUDO